MSEKIKDPRLGKTIFRFVACVGQTPFSGADKETLGQPNESALLSTRQGDLAIRQIADLLTGNLRHEDIHEQNLSPYYHQTDYGSISEAVLLAQDNKFVIRVATTNLVKSRIASDRYDPDYMEIREYEYSSFEHAKNDLEKIEDVLAQNEQQKLDDAAQAFSALKSNGYVYTHRYSGGDKQAAIGKSPIRALAAAIGLRYNFKKTSESQTTRHPHCVEARDPVKLVKPYERPVYTLPKRFDDLHVSGVYPYRSYSKFAA